ncbi:MAG: MFS transporter [Bacteroidetes bacterium]|nr:MFS transporter [Bacteroidota bacterium]
MEVSTIPVPSKYNLKTANAWAFYDWANSVYPLVITTAIFPIFYENLTSVTLGETIHDSVFFFSMSFKNTEIYSYVIAFSFLIVSVISPLLSGIADYTGSKKKFMKFFCYLGALSCASLYFFDVARLEWGLFSVMMASIGFWGSLIFYNAFLPEIAPPEDHDRLSAKGYSLGYIGSSILLILNLIVIMNYEIFGFENAHQPTQYAFLTVGLWWIGFAQVTFARLPDNQINRKPNGNNVVFKGFQELKKVWGELNDTPRLKRFLAAFFIYSMAVQTIMLMAVLFGKKEVKGMEDANLIISVLIIQFIAVGGAYLFSWLSSKIGNIKALGSAVFIWILICLGTYFFVYEAFHFYFAAAAVGLVMGGIQSLSRSTYSKLLPKTTDNASYFSFYEILEKLGIVIGMFSFGFIEGFTGSMRNSILALITFFVIGFILLLRIPKSKAVNPEIA